MKHVILFALSSLLLADTLFGEGAAPKQASPAPEAQGPAVTAPKEEAATEAPIVAEFKKLAGRIIAKHGAGKTAVADFETELKDFDTLLAKYKDQKDEDTAGVALMQAILFIQIFNDVDKAELYLKKVQQTYAGTAAAAKAKELLEAIPQMKQAEEAKRLNATFAPGVVMPDFAEKDLAGNPLSIAQFRGKIVLIDFWATWCGPCMAELPGVIAAYEKYHAKGFEIIGISLDAERAALDSLLKEKKMPWPQYFDGKDWSTKLALKYGISSIPSTFLLDGEGKIIARDLTARDLEARLETLLGGK